MEDSGSWPEQDAVDAWIEKHKLDIDRGILFELKKNVTAYRLLLQEKLSLFSDSIKQVEWVGECSCIPDDDFGDCPLCNNTRKITRPATIEECLGWAESSIVVNKVSKIPCYIVKGGQLRMKDKP